MTEIFKPRANMISDTTHVFSLSRWICCDENEQIVCDGGPSIIWGDGEWRFFIYDIGLHRLDGPATSGGLWFINNIHVTDEIHAFAKENNINLENLSDEDKILIALKFS